jgi:sn-glycerol 3-phosphate transport system substrate-binding protein
MFYKYLSGAEVQAKSAQATGYLPVTSKAYDISKASGFYEKNPGTDVAVKQMIVKTTDKSRGIRLGNFVQVRAVIDEELEGIWAGKKSPKEGLDSAVKRGNEILEKFEKAQKSAEKSAAKK